MADGDRDFVHLFVRDLDDIELPPRDRWRPAPRKESYLVKTSRFVLSAAAVAALVILALIASAGLRERNQVAVTPSPTPPTTAPATSTPSASPSASGSPQPTTPPAGAISGTLSYPANFVPPLTVYAVSVADQRIFFSVQTPRYGGDPNPSPSSVPVPPGGATFTITGVAPGTYYVFAYRDDNLPNFFGGPALYSKFVLTCEQPARAGAPIPSGACDSTTADHSLVPVTVRAGETVTRIDPWDWTSQQQVQQGNLPPRPR